MIDAIGSVNFSDPNVSGGDDKQLRGNINEHSVFDLNENWRTGLDLQRVSDQNYLLQFGFGNPLLNAEISRGYLEGFGARSSTDVDAYAFQPLVTGLSTSTQPIVLPVINRNWQSLPDEFGGRWNLNANLLNIIRPVGTQTKRISLGSEWERSFRDGIGGQYHFTASLRGDGYAVNDLSPASNPDLPSAFFPVNGTPAIAPINPNFVTGRAFPQVGLKWSYPLVHPGQTLTPLIEPIVGVYAGPDGGNQHKIPDEDSLSFDYDDSLLFRPDRLAGYDILDTGQRVDYGTKLGLYDSSGGSYRMLIGQSYRAETNPFLPPGSGAEQRLSDVVGRVVLSPSSYLDLIYRFRLDLEQFELSRAAGRDQHRAAEFAGQRQLRSDPGAARQRCRHQPRHRSEHPLRQAGADFVYGDGQADPLLVGSGQRDVESDQQLQSGQRGGDAGIERLQPLCFGLGDLPG